MAEIVYSDDDQKTEEREDKRESAEFWLKWIKSAKKAAKSHWDAAKEAWSEYEKNANSDPKIAGGGTKEEDRKVYPIYWSSCQTLEPAYYARPPRAIGKRRFDIDDPVANTASMLCERLGTFLIDNSCFDEAVHPAVQDFIHASKTSCQIVYDIETEEVEIPEAVIIGEDGAYMFADGSPVEGEIVQDEMGGFSSTRITVKETKRIRLSPLSFNEVLHTPEAKTQAEIREIAYHFSLSREEAEEKFGLDETQPIPWKFSKTFGDEEDADDDKDPACQYLEGWEIWCKDTRRVYHVCEGYPEFLKEPSGDEFKLRRFFPSTPFIFSSKPSKSLYPMPTWMHLRPTARQLNLMYSRVFTLIRSVRRRAIIDGSHPELLQAISELEENEFITVKNLQSIVEKGGLTNLIHYIPVAELITAISELNSLTEIFKANFYEWYGLPDIMRAASDPIESLGAQELKQGNANDRFKKNKSAVQQMVRDALEMMIDLALKVYSPAELDNILGRQYLQPEHQQYYDQAIALLKDDETRLVRIDIETDSTNFVDEQWIQQQRNTVSNTLVTGLQTIGQLSQNTPTFVPTALRALLSTLDGIQGGKDYEEGIKSAVNSLIKAAENPPPAPPPPPDYEMEKINLEREKLGLHAQELQLKAAQLELEREKVQADAMVKRVEAELKAVKLDHEKELESVWQQLESLKIALSERDRSAENQRLAVETQAKIAQSAPQPVLINMGGAQSEKPRSKIVTPIRDENGKLVQARIDEVN